ncbi:MAG TPA: hypothetical protein VFH85_07010 [Gammaproteobacteria bacterium]|nr:hypothetical protein [Gammaproteobacteria bacterium]
MARVFGIGCVIGFSLALAGAAAAGGAEAVVPAPSSFQIRIDKGGIHFDAADGHHFGMRLVEYGYSGHMQPAPRNPVTTIDGRIEIDHGVLTEWYRQVDSGIEQGFTIASRPEGAAADEPLTLHLELSGDMAAVPNPGGGFDLYRAAGKPWMRYGDLDVVDASGRHLAARMRLSGSDLVLTFDDSSAVYPIVVDPLFAVVRWLHVEARENSRTGYGLGSSIAISGNTVVAGTPFARSDHEEKGAVDVFNRLDGDGQWAMGENIDGPGGQFGSAVAFNGHDMVVGAPLLDAGGASASGGVFIFHLPYPESFQSADNELAIQYAAGGEHFGRALALGDNILVVGASGAAYVYRRAKGGTFNSQLVEKLTSPTGASGDAFGTAVAFDDETIVIGAPTTDGGSVYLFTADANGTFAQSAELTAPQGSAQFGAAVAVDDGVVLVGAPAAGGSGAAYVYVPDGGGFTRSAVLKAAPTDGAEFGTSVAMDDGRAIVGAPGISEAFLYYSVSSGDAPQLVKTLHGLSGEFSEFGKRAGLHSGVSVAIDGDVAAVGADELKQNVEDTTDDYTHSGSAYIIEPGIDLSVAVRPESVSAPVGTTITFTATVANHDPNLTAHHVTLTHVFGDVAPFPLSFVSSSIDCGDAQGALPPMSMNCELGTLAPGMSRNPAFTFKVMAFRQRSSTIDVDFAVGADEADQNRHNDYAVGVIHDPTESQSGGGGALGVFWLLILGGAYCLQRRH